MGNLVLSFLAGLLTIVNPCVLPLAPVLVLGAGARDVRGPLALAAGLAVTFGLVGGLVAALGAEIGESAWLRMPAGILVIPIGLMLMIPLLGSRVGHLLEPLVAFGNRLAERLPQAGLAGSFALGALLALVWAPCIGPTLGAALVLAGTQGGLPGAMLGMAVFAIGAATALLVAGMLVGRLSALGRGRARRTALIGRIALGAVLVLVGLGALTGLDRVVEGAIVSAMPDWLVRAATVL